MFLDFRKWIGLGKGPLSFFRTNLSLVWFTATKFSWFGGAWAHWRSSVRGKQITTAGVGKGTG